MDLSATQPRANKTTGRDPLHVLTDHCLYIDFESLPEAVVLATKNQILDIIGVSLAGREQSGAKQLLEFTGEMGGKAEARIWGSELYVPAQDAARVNATMAHALDFDDTHEKSFVHPAVITIPTALSIADMLGTVTGKQLITAIALGVDIACRLANSASPGVSGFEHGWHNTTLYGYFASTFVAGKLMGLSHAQLESAAGIAFHQVSGNAQAHIDGALTKRLGPGFASYGGILSARLAQRGIQGAKNVFEGERGFYRQYHDQNFSRDVLFAGLGETYAGTSVAFKPWPSCRGSHTAIEATLSLMDETLIHPKQIEKITVNNGPGEYSLLAAPLAQKQAPQTVVDAQFSNPWVVAAAIVDGKVGLDHFTASALRRSDLLEMAQKIQTREDPALLRPEGGPGPTRIEFKLKTGELYSRTVTAAKGEGKNPISSYELHEKFLECTKLAGLPRRQSSILLQTVLTMENQQQVADVTDSMTPS